VSESVAKLLQLPCECGEALTAFEQSCYTESA